MTKQVTNFSHLKTPGSIQTSRNQESNRHHFTSARNIWPKPFPSIAMMMQPPRPAGSITQYRHLCSLCLCPEMRKPNYKIGAVGGFEGVLRKDIMQYILQNWLADIFYSVFHVETLWLLDQTMQEINQGVFWGDKVWWCCSRWAENLFHPCFWPHLDNKFSLFSGCCVFFWAFFLRNWQLLEIINVLIVNKKQDVFWSMLYGWCLVLWWCFSFYAFRYFSVLMPSLLKQRYSIVKEKWIIAETELAWALRCLLLV